MESRLDKGITYVITRKVCPSACKMLAGYPFLEERFSKKGIRKPYLKNNMHILISTGTKTPPDHRGCFGLAIVPTGELDGRQDGWLGHLSGADIVPTGELDGRQDSRCMCHHAEQIVPTGELDGRQDR